MFPISYKEILNGFRSGLRNGNWHKLDRLKKALYKATLTYAKIKGKIVNPKLTTMIKNIIQQLKNTLKTKIWKNGIKKAKQLIKTFEEKRIQMVPKNKTMAKKPKIHILARPKHPTTIPNKNINQPKPKSINSSNQN